MRKTIISPSLLSADFLNLTKDLEMLNDSSADWVHVDMMDGVFVPNISIGFPVLSNLKKVCNKELDVHYMVVHPEQYIERTAKAGAKVMTVHQEACVHLHRTVSEIKTNGMMAGVALNPSTPICMLEDVIADIDMVLLMSVNPGFGGQKFIENTINKTRRLKQLIKESGSKALIEVDGGVNATTAPRLVGEGADILVSGSYIFKSPNPIKTISELSQL